jgi:signal transduction histidine kinase
MKRTRERRRFFVLTVTASLALLGIIGLQTHWLRASVRVKKEQLGTQVSAALTDFVRHLEKQRDADFIFDNYTLLSDPGTDLIRAEDELYRRPDSQMVRPIGSASLQGGSSREDLSRSGDGYEVVSNFSQEGEDFSRQGKVVIRRSVTDQGIRVSRKIYQLDSLFIRMMKEEYADQQALSGWLNRREVDSLLHEFLEQHGVHLGFAFGLESDDWLPDLSSEGFAPEKSEFSARLFPNHLGQQQGKVHVYFPDQRLFLFRSVRASLLLGGLFTLVMVVAFVRVVQLALDQKKLSEMKTDFINNMTHEFKTPIATISLALDAINNKKVIEDPEGVARYSELIRQENKRMNEQVENVLRLAMLERKELEMNFTSVDMHEFLTEALERFRLKSDSRNATIHLDLAASNSGVKADRSHMESVIQNLLDNALKYSDRDPEIFIQTANLNDKLLVKIKDQGMGMSAETLRYVFERFYRAPTGNLHDIKGHGLGLAYVREVLSMHDSEIKVQSSLGKGSTFFFYLSTYHEEN